MMSCADPVGTVAAIGTLRTVWAWSGTFTVVVASWTRFPPGNDPVVCRWRRTVMGWVVPVPKALAT